MELDEMEEDYKRRKAEEAAKKQTASERYSCGSSGAALTKWQEQYMMYGCAGMGLIAAKEWEDMI